MRTASLILFALALACEALAWWGLRTVGGQHAFDEMAGMIPLAAAAFGALLAVASAVAWWRSARGARSRKPDAP